MGGCQWPCVLAKVDGQRRGTRLLGFCPDPVGVSRLYIHSAVPVNLSDVSCINM